MKNIDATFAEHPKLKNKYIRFVHRIWATSVKWKSARKIRDIFYFENDIYRLLHEQSNIATFSVVHQKFPEIVVFFIGNVGRQWQIKISN